MNPRPLQSLTPKPPELARADGSPLIDFQSFPEPYLILNEVAIVRSPKLSREDLKELTQAAGGNAEIVEDCPQACPDAGRFKGPPSSE